jgi:hypothetical protein
MRDILAKVLAIIPAAIAILIAFCLLFGLVAVSSSQNAPEFQSVSGEFARDWIESFKAENPPPVQENENSGGENNSSNLWSWGGAPRGSRIEDSKLITDPNYLRGQLNLSTDWLGDAYTDPDTGLPLLEYLDPFTGMKTYTYLNPDTQLPIFTYYSDQDDKTGRTAYSYIDPLTGKAVYSSERPLDIINDLIGGLADQITSQGQPWVRL